MATTKPAPVAVLDLRDRDMVVRELRSLSKDDRLRRRAMQLDLLAADLEACSDLERWSEVDLFTAFLRDDTVTPRRSSKAGDVVDLLPAVLIFLPIMITWIGLFSATRAYRMSRGDATLRGKSFLEQWQTGFGGRLSGSLYFDRIALWTLIAILVLVSVSLTQSVLRRRADGQSDEERASLLNRLAAVLTAVDFQLAEFRMNDSSRLASAAGDLRKAAHEVQKASDAAKITQIEAQEGLKEVRTSLDRVHRLAEAMLQGEDSVRGAAQRVGDATAGIGAKLDALATATGTVASATTELSRSVGASSLKLSDSVQQSVLGSAKEIRTAVTDSQRDLGSSIGAALNANGTGIREALDEWRTEGAIYSHRHETTADHLGLIVGSIEQLMQRTADSIERLPEAVDQLEGHTQAAMRRLEAQTQAATQRLDTTLAEGTDRLKQQLDRFLVGLPETGGQADHVATEMAALRKSVDLLCRQIGDIAGSQPRRRWWSR